MLPYGGSEMQFCDLATKAGRYTKMKQASSGLSAIAELLVVYELPFWRHFTLKVPKIY